MVSKADQNGQFAGYHVYWTLRLPAQLVAAGAAAPRPEGPLLDPRGRPIVFPSEIDLERWSSKLPPASYRLVPVDAHGVELSRLPVIERVLGNMPRLTDHDAVVAAAVSRLLQSPAFADHVADHGGDADRHALLRSAILLASGEVFDRRNSGDLAGRGHDLAVEALVARTLDIFDEKDIDATALFTLDRMSFEHLCAHPTLCHTERIRAAVDRAGHDDAAIRALARIQLGFTLPAELIADILVGLERIDVFFVLARRLTGEALELLLDLLRRGRLATDPDGHDQTACTAFALWQMRVPDAVRPVILPRLRRLARQPGLSLRATGLVGWLASQIGDPHLTAIYEEARGELGVKLTEVLGQFALDTWSLTLEEVVALLPENAADQLLVGVPVRAAPKVGRNDLCPCGSGKKYKRCCADKPVAATAQAAPSRNERLRAIEPRLESEQLVQLSRADLARLDLTRLRDGAVIDVMRRQSQLHDWSRACLAVDELARRRGKEFADEHLQDVIFEATRERQYDVARDLMKRLDDPSLPADLGLEIELANGGPGALARVEAAALSAIRDERPAAAIDLAHATLRISPALGILIARGALQVGELLDGEILLDAIEEARDDLLLSPDDRAQKMFDALGGERKQKADTAVADAERARLARTAADLRTSLDDASGRLAALQRQVADRERELERKPPASEGPRPAPSADAERDRRSLRGKIDALQALIRERNEERTALRRQLAEATESSTTAAPTRPRGAPSEDADEGVEEVPGPAVTRPVVMPRFAATAEAACETVPRNVAATAMRTIGALAAGDAAVWRGVKQAADMPRQVLMVRIGLHHRLLFRAGEGALDALDLVTRESLLATLKRMRSA